MNGALYSTNCLLKLLIQERYFSDVHYVWCSEHFDKNALPRYTMAAHTAPSSNPFDIYRELKRDVDGSDAHSAKITAQRSSFTKLATDFAASGRITDAQKDEIIELATSCPIALWKPLIYVIPETPIIKGRMTPVPYNKRAGVGMEYIIADLKRDEFDIIEP